MADPRGAAKCPAALGWGWWRQATAEPLVDTEGVHQLWRAVPGRAASRGASQALKGLQRGALVL